ncbi:MAG TPA: tetratricopeptide repeat protein [Rhizomicrobium sp.]|nr:tetratricopeptide repeat protein [Rhizomicrobium sp.]
MSDIFQEVEEEVRKERFEQLWKQYGDYIVAAACLLVIAVAGFQLWRTYDQRQRLKASAEYQAAIEMIQNGQPGQAADQFGRLADSAPSGYKTLARLQHADALLAAGEKGDALSLYRQIAAGGDQYLAPLARIRWAWAIVDYSPVADVNEALGTLTSPSSPWSPAAREILAYWNFRNNKPEAAAAEYKALAKDMKAPAPLRERAGFMAELIGSGGARDYGQVPEPPPPPASDQQAQPGAPSIPLPSNPPK